MKAIAISRFGGPEVLEPIELPDPRPGPGEVSIDVAYCGANFAEVLFRQGAVDVPLPFVPGIEVSGHVRELGEGVDALRVGDAVAALTIVAGGGYGEVVVVPAALVVALYEPSSEGLAAAAATPSNSTTAFMVLESVAHLDAGERVLVHAAAGGVGSQLGQVAKLLGAGHVTGIVGTPAKAEAARALGYDEVLLRDEWATATEGEEFDVVVDQVGGPTRRASLDVLAPLGRLIAMGNASGAEDVPLSPNELWFASKTVSGFNLHALTARFPQRTRGALLQAVAAVGAGTLAVQVEELPLSAASDAHRRIESGASTGKLVLAVR